MTQSEVVVFLLAFGDFCMGLEDLPLDERVPKVEAALSRCTLEQQALLSGLLVPLARAKGLS